MLCPYCKEPNTQVIDSRTSEEGSVIRRRRKCPACGGRFTTYEKAALLMPQIIKNNGSAREPFSSEKLRRSMEIALRKRPVKAALVDEAVNSIERQLRLRGEKEVSSKEVGDLVLAELKCLDMVAYIRYGSVYLNFQTLEDFVSLVEQTRKL